MKIVVKVLLYLSVVIISLIIAMMFVIGKAGWVAKTGETISIIVNPRDLAFNAEVLFECPKPNDCTCGQLIIEKIEDPFECVITSITYKDTLFYGSFKDRMREEVYREIYIRNHATQKLQVNFLFEKPVTFTQNIQFKLFPKSSCNF